MPRRFSKLFVPKGIRARIDAREVDSFFQRTRIKERVAELQKKEKESNLDPKGVVSFFERTRISERAADYKLESCFLNNASDFHSLNHAVNEMFETLEGKKVAQIGGTSLK